MTKKFDLIYLEDGNVIAVEQKNTKENCYYLYGNKICLGNPDGEVAVIVASIKRIDDSIPLMVLEKDENKLAEEYVKSHPDFEVESMSEFQNGRFIGYVDGYKTAYKDKKYSEDDVRDSFKAGKNYGLYSAIDGKKPLNEDEYIQSLQPKYKEVELEIEYYNRPENGYKSLREDIRLKIENGYVKIVNLIS